jgi:hypothetical protein
MPNTIVPEQLAHALGLPLFQTELFLPDYPDGEWGRWRISHTGVCIDHGYYTRQWVISGMPVLLRRNSYNPDVWDTWMSLTPHEIESQEPGQALARGHTVIMGLGMGWIALNAAFNPMVYRVTVVECDPDVISLFNAGGVIRQAPPDIQAKIEVIQADALQWKPEEKVDFLYADIWRNLDEPNVLDDVHRMQKHVQTEAIYFWGQELAIYAAFRSLFGKQKALTYEGLRQCAREVINLPLVFPWGSEYANYIEAAIRNRRDRKLPCRNSGPEL